VALALAVQQLTPCVGGWVGVCVGGGAAAASPFLSGERATGWRGDATLTMHGITRGTEPHHIIRAGMEAVVLRLGEIFQRLRGVVSEDCTVVAAGGPLENVPLWGRMVSDTLGKTVQLVDASEVRRAQAAWAASLTDWMTTKTPLYCLSGGAGGDHGIAKM
jgi:sugar (pentulose or hexulose) kinase